MKNKKKLLEAIGQKKARICILGLGYVGLPLAQRFAEVGFPVLGIDIDEAKVEKIKNGVSCGSSNSRSIQASTDRSLLTEADVAIICVPTPLSKTKDPDLSLVLEAGRTIARYLHAGQLVVLESTTYPGTTRELLLPLFEEKGFKAGKDFYLAYSPERIDPGNKSFNLINTPKVVAGITPSCSELVQKLYSQVVTDVVPVSSPDTTLGSKPLPMRRSVVAARARRAPSRHAPSSARTTVVPTATTRPKAPRARSTAATATGGTSDSSGNGSAASSAGSPVDDSPAAWVTVATATPRLRSARSRGMRSGRPAEGISAASGRPAKAVCTCQSGSGCLR